MGRKPKNQTQPETVKPIAVELKETRKALKNERIRNSALKKANINLKDDLEVAREETVEEATKGMKQYELKNAAIADLNTERAKSIWTLIKEGRKWF